MNVSPSPKYRKNRVLASQNKSNIEMRDARWLSQIQMCFLGFSLPKSLFPVPGLVASSHTKIELVRNLSPKERFLRNSNFVSITVFHILARSWPCHILCLVHLMSEPNYLEQSTLALHSMGNWAITSQNNTKNFFSHKHQRAFLHDALAMQRFHSYFWCGSKA